MTDWLRWSLSESNGRPSAFQTDALPTELRDRAARRNRTSGMRDISPPLLPLSYRRECNHTHGGIPTRSYSRTPGETRTPDHRLTRAGSWPLDDGRMMLMLRSGGRARTPNIRVQGPAFCRLNYSRMEPTAGTDPASPGWRPGALPLSYVGMVRLGVPRRLERSAGLEPATFALARRRSAE